MLNVIRQVKEITTPKEQLKLLLLAVPVCVFALLNVVGVGVILPFMAVATDPSNIAQMTPLAWAYAKLGFTGTQPFLIFLGCLCFGFLVLVNGFGALLVWLNAKITNEIGVSLQTRLLHMYLHQPYAFFLGRHSATMANRVLQMVPQVKIGVVFGGITMFSNVLVVCCVALLLMVADPRIAIMALLSVGSAYAVIYWGVKKNLEKLSQTAVRSGDHAHQTVVEAFGGIKDLSLSGRQGLYIQEFKGSATVLGELAATVTCIQGMPRYVFELVAFGGVLLMVVTCLAAGETLASLLPVLSMFVYAGYRLLPVTQNLLNGLSTIKSSLASLNALHVDYTALSGAPLKKTESELPAMPFDKRMTLVQVGFRYPSAVQQVLHDVSIEIEARSVTGIIGPTGAGKTTLVDLMLGLLSPDAGSIMVDGVLLDETKVKSWQKNLGYVPQHIFLSDDSIANNIALGVPADEVDMQAVQEAAKAAAIHDFVVSDLPDGYNSKIGEHGIRLSGGQRQRIGIARALYHRPKVLVLDEATSALDGVTENAVMQAIHVLAHQITIVVIAHRLSTVKRCDQVLLMESGRVVAKGSFDRLLAEQPRVQAMAHLAS